MVGENLYFNIIKFFNKNSYYHIMEIRENDTLCILAPLSKKLDMYETERIFSELEKESRQIAMDLYY